MKPEHHFLGAQRGPGTEGALVQQPQVHWAGKAASMGPRTVPRLPSTLPHVCGPSALLAPFTGGGHGMVARGPSALCPFSRPAAVLGSLGTTGVHQAPSPWLCGHVALPTSHSDPFSGSFVSLLYLPPSWGCSGASGPRP